MKHTFLIVALMTFIINCEAQSFDHGSLYNKIFNYGLSPGYNIDSYPVFLIDSLERITDLPPQEQVIKTIQLFKSRKLDTNALNYLIKDTTYFRVPLLDTVNITELAYFIFKCEAIRNKDFAEISFLEDDKIDDYFENYDHNSISAFATLNKSLKTIYTPYDPISLDFIYYPDILINSIYSGNDWTANKWKTTHKDLVNSILTSYHDRYTPNSDYYKILIHILTRPINSKKEWKLYHDLGEKILNPKLDYSKDQYLDVRVYKYGMSFQSDYEKAFLIRYISSSFFCIKDIKFLEANFKKNIYLNIMSILKPDIFNQYQTLEDVSDLNITRYDKLVNERLYHEMLKSLIYISVIGNPKYDIVDRINFFLFYKIQ